MLNAHGGRPHCPSVRDRGAPASAARAHRRRSGPQACAGASRLAGTDSSPDSSCAGIAAAMRGRASVAPVSASVGRVGADARPRQRCACFSGGSGGVGRAGARRQAAELPWATSAATGRRSRLPPGDPDSWRRPESAPLRRGGRAKRIIRLRRAKCCEARNTLPPGRGR